MILVIVFIPLLTLTNGYPIIGQPFLAPQWNPSPATENPSPIQEIILTLSTAVPEIPQLETTKVYTDSTTNKLESTSVASTTQSAAVDTVHHHTSSSSTRSDEDVSELLTQTTVVSSTAVAQTSSPSDISTTSLPVTKAEAKKLVDDSAFEHFSMKPQIQSEYSKAIYYLEMISKSGQHSSPRCCVKTKAKFLITSTNRCGH